jgi:hypothetical protein
MMLARPDAWQSTTVISHSVWRCPVFEHCYLLTVDSGAPNQGSADSAGYGSFRLEARTGQKQMIRLDFGRGVTNNEAEYQTLIAIASGPASLVGYYAVQLSPVLAEYTTSKANAYTAAGWSSMLTEPPVSVSSRRTR